MKPRRVLPLALLIVILLTTSCVGPEKPRGLHISGLGEPKTLDPHKVVDAVSVEYVMEVFGGLVTINPDFVPCPDLAERWEVAQDGTVYIFHLNRDARFHNGKRVTAHDFKNSIERATDPKTENPLVALYLRDIVGVEEKLAGKAGEVRGVEVLDNFTLTIEIQNPSMSFLSKLATPPAFVVDLENVESGQGWWRSPNGTGPFRLEELTTYRMVLQANNQYHLGAPKLQQVTYNFVRSATDVLAYERNEVDILYLDDLHAALLLEEMDSLVTQMQAYPRATTIVIMFNMEIPPFDDLKVRQAFTTAIHKEVIAGWFSGAVTLANTITPPVVPNYMPSMDVTPYDPAKARRLLDESKYAGRLPPVTLSQAGILSVEELQQNGLRLVMAGTSPQSQTEYWVSIMLADMWRKNLGINIRHQQEDASIFCEKARAGQLQMLLTSWEADYPEPELVLHDFLHLPFYSRSAGNWNRYSNNAVDQLLDIAHSEKDLTKQLDYYEKVEETVISDVAWVPLLHLNWNVLVKPRVRGWPIVLVPIPKLRSLILD